MTKKTNVIVLKDVRIAFPHVYTPVRPYGCLLYTSPSPRDA